MKGIRKIRKKPFTVNVVPRTANEGDGEEETGRGEDRYGGHHDGDLQQDLGIFEIGEFTPV
jgi:hypothetical protein